MTDRVLIEVCCGSIDDAIQAELGGADRIELNSSLFLGGLTPSVGTLIEVKKRLKIPVMVMVRPRAAGFCYTEAEMSVMENDAKIAIEYGADGIVFGFLHEDGTVDIERCKRMMEVIGDRQAVFHRAFDVVPEPFEALDRLADMGINRVLTSGQESSVFEGAELIGELIKYAGSRIEILPGAGITPKNINKVVKITGCNQVHVASFCKRPDRSTSLNPQIYYGGALYPPEDSYDIIDRKEIDIMCTKVNK